MKRKIFFGMILFSLSFFVSSCEDDQHEKHDHKESSQAALSINPDTLRQINTTYQELLPVFRKACFDCHSKETNYPWYFKLPLVSNMIRHDIKKARKHLLMGESFPFEKGESPGKDLEEIAETIEENDMPPLKYQIMHWAAFLSKEEKKAILEWTENSIKLIGYQEEGEKETEKVDDDDD